MTDAFTSSDPTVAHQSLQGLPQETPCLLRSVAGPTLFSLANRLLRPDFSVQRDYEVFLQLVGKGLASPQTSRQQLSSLPLRTLESLAARVMTASLTADGTHPLSGLDRFLALIIAVEEARQFDLEALVSEDLAQFEARQSESLHGYYFKGHQKPELYAQVLQSQGYRTDVLGLVPEKISAALGYWLCRRLSVVLPWSLLLQAFPTEQAESFPYVERLRRIAEFVAGQGQWIESPTAEVLIESWLPQVQQWIETEFRGFSKVAGVPRPVETLILVEGNTEFLLLPVIAGAMGYNLDAEGILVQAVGGKNQMLQQYVNSAEHLSVPICVVLDQDAAPLMPDLTYYKRETDQIFLLEQGEFEDLYDLELIVKTVNRFYQPTHPLHIKVIRDMAKTEPNRVKLLQTIWQAYGLGPFDKVSFAQRLVECIQAEKKLKGPMAQLVQDLIETKRRANASFSA